MKLRYLYALLSVFIFLAACEKDNNSNASVTGKGGSLARFTIANGYLYVVDGEKLNTFSLQDPAEPVLVNSLRLGFSGSVETIFPWKDKLFIGSTDAMYVVSASNPGEPVVEGTASHLRACDPVVADDKYAYVTVRTGNRCGGDINALYTYDISGSPTILLTGAQNLNNPHGLGLHNKYLYVCDGEAGLVIFDISDSANPKKTATKSGYTFFDCIPVDNMLICMVEGGMVLYDISNPASPALLSEIN